MYKMNTEPTVINGKRWEKLDTTQESNYNVIHKMEYDMVFK